MKSAKIVAKKHFLFFLLYLLHQEWNCAKIYDLMLQCLIFSEGNTKHSSRFIWTSDFTPQGFRYIHYSGHKFIIAISQSSLIDKNIILQSNTNVPPKEDRKRRCFKLNRKANTQYSKHGIGG